MINLLLCNISVFMTVQYLSVPPPSHCTMHSMYTVSALFTRVKGKFYRKWRFQSCLRNFKLPSTLIKQYLRAFWISSSRLLPHPQTWPRRSSLSKLKNDPTYRSLLHFIPLLRLFGWFSGHGLLVLLPPTFPLPCFIADSVYTRCTR